MADSTPFAPPRASFPRPRRAACAAILAAPLAACGLGGPAYTEPTPSGVAATVDMTTTLNYVPETVRVRAGDTVEWRNRSLVGHTVTTIAEKSDSPERVRIPDGAQPFDSGNVPPGEIWRHAFETPGEYRYFCIPHDQLGMWGTVIVEP